MEAAEFLQDGQYILDLEPPSDTDRQKEMALLFDHVQEHEPTAVSRDMELDP